MARDNRVGNVCDRRWEEEEEEEGLTKKKEKLPELGKVGIPLICNTGGHGSVERSTTTTTTTRVRWRRKSEIPGTNRRSSLH